MHQGAARQQSAGRVDCGDDRRVGVARLAVRPIDRAAGKQRHLRQIDPIGADGIRHRQIVRLTELEVIGAMTGGDVDEAGALVALDEIGGQQRDLEIVTLAAQRMARGRSLEHFTRKSANDGMRLDAGAFCYLLDQRLGDEQGLAGPGAAALGHPLHPHRHIVELGAVGDGAIARQCPRRRRPDQRRGIQQRRQLCADDRKPHPDRGRSMIVILDLGFGERGLFDDRPENRLGTLEEPAIDKELADLADNLCLRGIGHRRVRVLPVADHPEPLEIAFLHLDPMRREGAAFPPELSDRHAVLGLVLGPVLFLDDPFDRQPVAVPAGHIGRVLAEHLLRAVDDVLQDLVQHVAEVKVGVRVRRAVVQDEFFPPRRRLAQPTIEIHRLPAGEDRRLALWQVSPHRERGLG